MKSEGGGGGGALRRKGKIRAARGHGGRTLRPTDSPTVSPSVRWSGGFQENQANLGHGI